MVHTVPNIATILSEHLQASIPVRPSVRTWVEAALGAAFPGLGGGVFLRGVDVYTLVLWLRLVGFSFLLEEATVDSLFVEAMCDFCARGDACI